MASARLIATADLGIRQREQGAPDAQLDGLTLDEAERLLIQNAMRRADGNVSEAARALGLSRSALYRRLKAHGL